MRLATGSVALRLAGDSIAIAAPSVHLPYLAAGTSAVLAPTDTTIHYREPAPLIFYIIGRSFFRTDSFQNRKQNLESESRLEPIARTNNTPATRLATLVGLAGKARDLIFFILKDREVYLTLGGRYRKKVPCRWIP